MHYCNMSLFADFNWKRVVSRTCMVAIVLFVAETVPHFGAILSFVGGSTTTLLAYICPPLFYLKLSSAKPGKDDTWEERFVFQYSLFEIIFL